MEIKMNGTVVLEELLKMRKRVRVLEGGSRSSKSWSILQWLILYCARARNAGVSKVVTVARARLTWTRATILQDWLRLLKEYGLYSDKDWNKSEMTYNLFGCEVWFCGLDDPQRLHGRKQDVVYINEAMECSKEDWDQLEMRTTECLILDFNPSYSEHWLFSSILTRPDVDYLHSTMLDNQFLEPAIRAKILSYEPTPYNVEMGTADEQKWKVYGLGVRAAMENAVLPNHRFVKEFPELAEWWVGLDFGFTNDPTAGIRVALQGGELWLDELLYERGLTNQDISSRLGVAGVGKGRLIVCDSAEPKSIEELRRQGWKATGCAKGPDSVKNSIDVLKRYRLNVTERSINLKTELANYTWRKDRGTGRPLNIPVDDFNHLIDAARYVALECLRKARNPGTVMFTVDWD